MFVKWQKRALFCTLIVGTWASILYATGFVPGQYGLDANTIVLYHLNQTSGTSVVDSTANHVNGTLMGSPYPTWMTGDFGNGIHDTENGADWLQVGTFVPDNCTVEFYFKWDYRYVGDLGYLWYAPGEIWARGNLVDNGESPATYTITYGVVRPDAGSETVTTPISCVLDTNWHHFAFTRTWNGTNTAFSIYIDGTLQGSGSFAGRFSGGGSNIHIGYTMAGTFDEIRVSNFARSAAELGIGSGNAYYEPSDINKDRNINIKDFALLAKEWSSCTNPNAAECINCNNYLPYSVDDATLALWHMDEGTPSTIIYDATMNHYDLNINVDGGDGFAWGVGQFDKGLQATTPHHTSFCRTTTGLPLANMNGTNSGTNQVTVSAWVNLTGPYFRKDKAIIEVNDAAYIRIKQNGTKIIVGFNTWSNHGTWIEAVAEPFGPAITLNDGKWHNVSAVYNGIADSAGNANVYIFWDGLQVASASIAANTDIEAGHGSRIGLTLVDNKDGRVSVGNSIADASFEGSIDEVMISKTARTKFVFGICE